MRLSTRTYLPILSSTLVATLLGASSCKKEEPAATTPPPPPEEKKEPTPPPPPPEPPKPAFEEVAGFSTPESTYYFADQDIYLVSNINGEPAKADDNGFISKVGNDGKVIELKWIDGADDDVKLNAPKGSAVQGGKLYVADIDVVRVFDAATGKQEKDVTVKGATFLNDVAAGGDKVYVTDSGMGADLKPNGSDAVYEIDKGGKVKKHIGGAELKSPNGLLVVDGQVWVNTFGAKEIFRIEGGKKVDVLELPTGGLDGFVALGDGRVAVSSWEGKAIYAGKPGPGAVFAELVKDVEAPADLGVDTKRKKLLVPMFMGNTVRIYPVE